MQVIALHAVHDITHIETIRSWGGCGARCRFARKIERCPGGVQESELPKHYLTLAFGGLADFEANVAEPERYLLGRSTRLPRPHSFAKQNSFCSMKDSFQDRQYLQTFSSLQTKTNSFK